MNGHWVLMAGPRITVTEVLLLALCAFCAVGILWLHTRTVGGWRRS